MVRINQLVYVMLALALIAGMGSAQQRRRTKPKPPNPARVQPIQPAGKRPVTVNLIEGEPVKGKFLEADAGSVQVEVPGGRLTISLKNVASLVFAPEEAEAKPKEEDAAAEADPYDPVARKARAELRKLAEAAEIKLPYGQYGSLLIEVKPVVEELAASLPECPLKLDILRAIEVYTDAGRAWGAADTRGRIPIATEPGAGLMKKYGIRPELNRLAQPDHLLVDTALSAIWGRARFFYNNLSSYIRQ